MMINLLALITQRGYNRRTIAKELNRSETFVGMALNGKSFFNTKELKTLINVLQIEEKDYHYYFFGGN